MTTNGVAAWKDPDGDGIATATRNTATEADVTGLVADLAAKAPIASPAFTGTVSMPQTGLPDNFTANENFARVGDTGAVQTAALKPVLYPIEPKGRRTFALDSLLARISTSVAASTFGMAIYSVTYSSTTFTATLVCPTGSLSGVTGGIIKGQVTGFPVTLNFNTTLYFAAHMVSTITTLAFNGSNARQFSGALIYTGSARSSVTDWPTTIDNNAGGANNGTGTTSSPGNQIPWMALANAAGANWA